ncbi:MAG: PIN domain-containing protein [Gammaproteobacteria bacterium]
MSLYLDSSVLIAALVEDEPAHESCLQLLRAKDLAVWTHALAECFSTLTGGRLGVRTSPAIATQLIESSLLPRLKLIDLAGKELMQTIRSSNAAGARGGAIYDLMHLAAARKSSAKKLFTLNVRHFEAIAVKGDPNIELPV